MVNVIAVSRSIRNAVASLPSVDFRKAVVVERCALLFPDPWFCFLFDSSFALSIERFFRVAFRSAKAAYSQLSRSERRHLFSARCLDSCVGAVCLAVIDRDGHAKILTHALICCRTSSILNKCPACPYLLLHVQRMNFLQCHQVKFLPF